MSPSDNSDTGLTKASNSLGKFKVEMPDLKLPSIVMPADTKNFDFLGTLDEMKKNIKSDETLTGNGLALDEGLSPKVIDLDGFVSDKFVDTDQRLLEEANQLIQLKKYTKAIEVLNKLLEGSPRHHQALYMKAVCYASKEGKGIEETEIALEILLPLTKARLKGTLEAKVRVLRDRVKKEVLLYIVIEQLLFLRTSMRKNVISRLQRLIKLVPEEPIYHFMLSGTLMMEERYAEAIEAVDKALEELPKKNSGMLLELRAEIIRRQVYNALKPVLADFKKEQYSKAHKELKSLDKAIRKNPIYVIFDNYLKDQRGGFFSRMHTSMSESFWPVYISSTLGFKSATTSKSIAKNIMPRGGTKKDIEEFYLFICGDELKKAQKYIMSGDAKRAERVLRQVVEKWAPTFPYANYLCAIAIYSRLQKSFATQQVPALEEAIADLKTAVKMIKIGNKDPKIRYIDQLSKAVDGTLKALLEVRKNNQEAMLVKKNYDQFEVIAKVLSNPTGIKDYKDFELVIKGVPTLRNSADKDRRGMKDPQARKAMDNLIEQLDKILGMMNR